MTANDDGMASLSLEMVVVYLTVVARAARQLDQAHGAGATGRFLKALDRSLEAEVRLSRPDEAARWQLSELQKVLVRLVRDMPSGEEL